MLERVKANVRYLNPEWRGRAEVPRIWSKETRRAYTSFHTVEVSSARPLAERGELDLDRHGFALVPHSSRVRNFRDDGEVRRVYYPEIEALIRRLTQPAHVEFYRHSVRTENPTEFNSTYARYVHSDYSAENARQMAQNFMVERGVISDAEAERCDFAWYTVWQPIEREVQTNPLLLIDAQSVDPENTISYAFSKVDEGAYTRGYAPLFSERHRHHYFPRMRTDELIVLKQADSRPDRAHLCPHTSFDDPNSPPGALRRRNIEVRMVCLFEPPRHRTLET